MQFKDGCLGGELFVGLNQNYQKLSERETHFHRILDLEICKFSLTVYLDTYSPYGLNYNLQKHIVLI